METVPVYVIQGIGYGFAAAVQPGPFQTYVIAQTLNSAWRNTLPAAFAPLISDGPIIDSRPLVRCPSEIVRIRVAGCELDRLATVIDRSVIPGVVDVKHRSQNTRIDAFRVQLDRSVQVSHRLRDIALSRV